MPSHELVQALLSSAGSRARIAVLARSVVRPEAFLGVWIDAPPQGVDYAHMLYANLRTLDALGANEIWIEAPPDDPDWAAVNDRLRRATHPR
jgi:L-threonylcarbamoyladenylate synthase